MIRNTGQKEHIVWLDVIRLAAILMVIGVHCIDPFYISPAMRGIPEYTHWATVYVQMNIKSSIPTVKSKFRNQVRRQGLNLQFRAQLKLQ